MICSILVILHSPIKNPTSVPSLAVPHDLLVNVLRAPRPVRHQHRNSLFFSSLSTTRTSLPGFEKVKPQLFLAKRNVCVVSLLSPGPLVPADSGNWASAPNWFPLVPAHLCPPLPTSAHRCPLPNTATTTPSNQIEKHITTQNPPP